MKHSEATLAFLRLAIADSTRATYLTATRAYREWCTEQRTEALPLTEQSVAAWLTKLGVERRLHSKTIRVYASALSTMHLESALSAAGNPVRSTLVQRVLDGIDRSLAPSEAAKRAARPITTDMTPDLLRELEPILRAGTPLARMLWAAATAATFGMLRPGELLGTQQKRKAGLAASCITFYRAPESDLVQSLLPAHESLSAHAIPDRFTIDLGRTKTDQLERAPAHAVAAPIAVRAMWQWMHLRRGGSAFGPELFRPAGRIGKPLALTVLLSWLTDGLTTLGYTNIKLTGKCFRRGGATGLVAGGLGPQQAAERGRWKVPGMVAVYASNKAKRSADLAVSRQM